MPSPDIDTPGLDRAGDQLSARDRAMLEARVSGLTLDAIGKPHGVTRERARQIIRDRSNEIIADGDKIYNRWREELAHLGSRIIIREDDIASALGASDPVIIDVFARAAGLKRAQAWNRPLKGLLTAHQSALEETISQIAGDIPARGEDIEARILEKLGDGHLADVIFGGDHSPVTQDPRGHWVRRRSRIRDSAYLWLLEQGEPRKTDDIARAVNGGNQHSVREALRRDERFRQIRPTGTWTLAEWGHIDVPEWASAVDAVIDAVARYGPIDKAALFGRVVESYPVTSWRLQQCLLHEDIGVTADGKIDLTSRGATPIEEDEPAQPTSMACPDGKVIGVRLDVNKDLLRGSGISVNSWLTWRLGLRRAPMSLVFDAEANLPPVTIRRGTATAQISTLRKHSLAQGLVIGCEIVLMLRMESLTVKVLHVCSAETCPGPFRDPE